MSELFEDRIDETLLLVLPTRTTLGYSHTLTDPKGVRGTTSAPVPLCYTVKRGHGHARTLVLYHVARSLCFFTASPGYTNAPQCAHVASLRFLQSW